MTESELQIDGQRFFVRDHTNDSDVIRSCRNEYDLPNVEGYEPGSFIIDIGSHIGGFSIRACQQYHNSRVIAVEALPENQALFMRNVEANNLQDRVILLRAAAWSTKEPTVIVPYGDLSTESGRMHHWIGNAGAAQQPGIKQAVVKTIGLSDIMAGVDKVWCLKIDCEGGEYPLIEEADSDDLLRCQWLIGEFHDGIKRLDDVLLPLNFIKHPKPEYPAHFIYENPVAFRFL